MRLVTFVISALFLISTNHALGAPKCPFDEIAFKTEKGKLLLSKANYQAFDRERTNLQDAYQSLTSRFREMEHVVKTMFLSLMGETHAYVFGEPGGAKSAIVRAILNMPLLNPMTGEFERSVFSLQMQQLLGDQPFKGFIDYEKLENDAGKKGEYENTKRRVKASEVQNRGTMIQFDRALIDELEKGNPIAAAAILDVLNEKVAQYGGVTVRVNTKSVTTTSNMTPYEFLEMMSQLGMESTAKPFLDRLVYKVYAHNWITDASLRIAARKDAETRRKQKKEKYLTDPKSIRSGEDAKEVDPESLVDIELPPVNFPWLGALATRFNSEPDVFHVTDQVFDSLRATYGNKRMETKAAYAADPQNALPPYFPPFIFSTRNYLEYTDPTIQNSLLLDLMLVPKSVLPSDKLLDFLADGGATVGMRSTYRASQLATTNAVGGARMVPTKDGKNWTLEWGNQLDSLIQNPLDTAEKANREYIQWERERFTELWQDRVNKIQGERKTSSGLLQDFASKLGLSGTKSRKEIKDIEELLFYLNQQNVDNSGN